MDLIINLCQVFIDNILLENLNLNYEGDVSFNSYGNEEDIASKWGEFRKATHWIS